MRNLKQKNSIIGVSPWPFLYTISRLVNTSIYYLTSSTYSAGSSQSIRASNRFSQSILVSNCFSQISRASNRLSQFDVVLTNVVQILNLVKNLGFIEVSKMKKKSKKKYMIWEIKNRKSKNYLENSKNLGSSLSKALPGATVRCGYPRYLHSCFCSTTPSLIHMQKRFMMSSSNSGNNGRNIWKLLQNLYRKSPQNPKRPLHTKSEPTDYTDEKKPKIVTAYWISKPKTEEEKFQKHPEEHQEYVFAQDLETPTNNHNQPIENGSNQIHPQDEPADLVASILSHPQVHETHNPDNDITGFVSYTHTLLSKEKQKALNLEMVASGEVSKDSEEEQPDEKQPKEKPQHIAGYNRERTTEEKNQLYYHARLTKLFYGDKPRSLLDEVKDKHILDNYKTTDRVMKASKNAIRNAREKKTKATENNNNIKNEKPKNNIHHDNTNNDDTKNT